VGKTGEKSVSGYQKIVYLVIPRYCEVCLQVTRLHFTIITHPCFEGMYEYVFHLCFSENRLTVELKGPAVMPNCVSY
jgi:hypothetical protein